MAYDMAPSSTTGASNTSLQYASSPRVREPQMAVMQRVAGALNKLSDREFRELGIRRYEIGIIAKGLAERG
ncbi:hypothetical protein [Pontibaca salina]|uniref:DUF1127 domain-containing protein n=1 Tax=Pontibaca salina TaxID=2795731 RepID=A0A934LZX1_9RHOB|nr:hypothetical protein [Pontibaca salina]MBI6629425.1 hypothetical protein [Pontibaca salina]